MMRYTVERREIAWFLQAYDDYVGKMKLANEDGGGRSIASIRELVTSALWSVLARKYYQTKAGKDLKEDEVREGSEKLGGLDNEDLDEATFEREIVRITKMEGHKGVMDRILALEQKIEKYVEDRNLEGVAVTKGKWTPEHGQVVVNALLDGVVLPAFRTTIRKAVTFHRVFDDPLRVIEIIYPKGEKQLFARNSRLKCSRRRVASSSNNSNGSNGSNNSPELPGHNGMAQEDRAPEHTGHNSKWYGVFSRASVTFVISGDTKPCTARTVDIQARHPQQGERGRRNPRGVRTREPVKEPRARMVKECRLEHAARWVETSLQLPERRR